MYFAPIISKLSCKWCHRIRGLCKKNDINHKFGLILTSVTVCSLSENLVDWGRDLSSMKGSHLNFCIIMKNFLLIHSVCTFLMCIHLIISNCNVVENECVNKCNFMFYSVIFFSNQDSAERNDVRLKRASEVSSGSAQKLLTGMGQLIGKGWLIHIEGIDGLNYFWKIKH